MGFEWNRIRSNGLTVAVGSAIALLAAPHAASAGSCTPGQQVACACPGGGPEGVQVCDDAGKKLGPCQCEARPAKAQAGCDGDGDCPGTQVCADAVCSGKRSPQGKAPEGRSEAREGAACDSDNGCSAMQKCESSRCVPRGESRSGNGGQCSKSADCGEGARCVDNECESGLVHRHNGVMISGAVVLPIGVVLLASGTLACVSTGNCDPGPYPAPITLWINGGIATIAGVVLLSYGAPMVKPEPRASGAAFRVAPIIGPGFAGLQGVF
jgi:hypothetical protein